MWKLIYDAVLTMLTSPWAAFMHKHGKPGRLVRDLIQNDVYQYSGIILFLVCLISCLLYYFYFNKRFGNYYAKQTWFKWMFVTSFVVSLITFIVGRSVVSDFPIIPTTPLIAWVSVINYSYAIILFFILSLFCQLVAIMVRRLFSLDLSPMGSRTPF